MAGRRHRHHAGRQHECVAKNQLRERPVRRADRRVQFLAETERSRNSGCPCGPTEACRPSSRSTTSGGALRQAGGLLRRRHQGGRSAGSTTSCAAVPAVRAVPGGDGFICPSTRTMVRTCSAPAHYEHDGDASASTRIRPSTPKFSPARSRRRAKAITGSVQKKTCSIDDVMNIQRSIVCSSAVRCSTARYEEHPSSDRCYVWMRLSPAPSASSRSSPSGGLLRDDDAFRPMFSTGTWLLSDEEFALLTQSTAEEKDIVFIQRTCKREKYVRLPS